MTAAPARASFASRLRALRDERLWLPALLAGAAFAIDVAIPRGAGGAVLYILAVLGCLAVRSARCGIVTAAACSVLTVAGYALSADVGVPSELSISGRVLAFLALWMAALLLVQRDRAERRSLVRERELASLVDSAPLGVASFDRAHRYLRVNDQLAAMNGIPAAAHIGRRIEDVLPVNAVTVGPVIDRVFETGEAVANLEVSGETPQEAGVRRHWLTGFYPVRNADGATRAVGAWVTDISERQRMEQALRDSEERYRLVNRATNDVVWDWDLTRGELLWNEAIEAVFGYRVAEVPCSIEWWSGRIHPEDRERVIAGVHAVIDGGGSAWHDEYRFRRADGGYARVLDRGHVQRRDGAAVRMIGAMLDLTERLAAEEALRKSERFFRQMLESIPGMTFANLPDGTCDFVSRQWEEFTGVPAAQQYGAGWLEMLHPDDRERAATAWRAAVEGRGGYDLEYRVRRRDGRYEWFKVRGRPLRDDAGRILRWVGAAIDVDDIKAAERALRESHALLSDVFDALPVGVGRTDGEGNTLWLNAAALALHGFPSMEAMYTSLAQYRDAFVLSYPDGRPLPLEEWPLPRALRGEMVTDYEVGLARRDGEVRIVAYTVRPLPPVNGERQLVFLMHDVTARKRAETALRESEERFRTLADNMSQLAWMADPTGNIFWYNRRWYEYTGTDLETVRGWGWTRVHHPGHVERVLASIRRAWETGEPWEETFPLRGADGAYRWFLSRAIPIRDAGGSIVRWFGTNTDITALRLVEQALRESGERLRLAVEAAGMAAWDWDIESGAVRWNDGHYRMFGYEPGAVQPDYDLWLQRVHPDERAAVVERLQRAVAQGGEYADAYRVQMPDGSVRHIEARGWFERGAQGRSVRAYGVLPDRTEAQRTEQALREQAEQLREADRRKDVFLATLAHELRNPLAPIRTASEILNATNAKPADLAASRAIIARQVRHMAVLLDDLLDISRITRGTLALKKDRVDLREVIDAAVETARPLIDARRHRLTLALPGEPLHLEADGIRLTQILSNLLANAAKYTDPGGDIALAVRSAPQGLVIAVRDNGIGLAPQALAHVFDMFSQVQPGGDRAQGGLGIGLALVKGLVELHGGRVEAESAGPGKGSEFRVVLPSASLLPAAHDDGTGGTDAAPRSARKVLVADDNRDAAESLAMLIEIDGHEVHRAGSGSEALDLAARVRPEILVLDIGMPGMDGYEVARRVRREPWGAQVRLIALTGWGEPEDRRRSRAAGFDHHLTKPVDPAVIHALLQ